MEAGDLATWAGVLIALGLGVASFVVAILARKDSKASAESSERSAAAAERSAIADQETHELERKRHHQERTPQFTPELQWLGESHDIPVVKLDYISGPDLDRMDVTVETAHGHRQAFHLKTPSWSAADLRRGGTYEVPITPPDHLGGRCWMVCHCKTADDDWTVRPVVDIPAVGSLVDWEIQRTSENGYALRNVGTERATGVTASALPEELAGGCRDLPKDDVIDPDGYARFAVFSGLGGNVDAIVVTWDGVQQPRTIQLPPW